MKAAFIFDTILAIDENNNYFGMTLNYDFFKERYLTMFDSIIVITRLKKKKDVKGTQGYKIVNGNNVFVEPIKEYREIPDAFLHKKNIVSDLERLIQSVDKVIIRMPSVLGIFAAKICNKINKEYIIELVACPLDGYINHTNPIGKIIAPIMYLKTKKAIQIAPNVLYVTDKFLQKRYPTRGNKCACSDVVLNELSREIVDARINKLENTNINNLKICTVANVGLKYKGHKYVFRAISKLKKDGKNYKYYLVGNGDPNYLKRYAKKLNIEDNVIFCGSLSHENVFKKLEEVDLYIQPSLTEGLPRALIEAMSLGLPAIGSNAGGIPELLDESMIFKKKNVYDLLDILNSLNKDRLIENINRNFKESKKYLPNNLNEKRKRFYLNKVE